MNILWWHWLVLGLVLVVSELATPGGFYIVFFGVGALVVGVLAGFDMAGPVWTQLLLFSFISIMSIVLFRRRLLRMFQTETQAPTPDQLVGQVAVAVEDLAPGAMGRVELRGAAWSARNDATIRGAVVSQSSNRARVPGSVKTRQSVLRSSGSNASRSTHIAAWYEWL